MHGPSSPRRAKGRFLSLLASFLPLHTRLHTLRSAEIHHVPRLSHYCPSTTLKRPAADAVPSVPAPKAPSHLFIVLEDATEDGHPLQVVHGVRRSLPHAIELAKKKAGVHDADEGDDSKEKTRVFAVGEIKVEKWKVTLDKGEVLVSSYSLPWGWEAPKS